jgi:hypothetical protein
MGSLRDAYLDWPHEVSIETFAKCNAACTFCPYTTLDRIGEKMPDEMLDRIVEELKDHPWPFILSPFKVNEPLLDKRLIPFLRKVNAEVPNAVLRIFTNGSALTPRHIEDIASLGRVMHLWVSLNDHRAEVYGPLMSLDFDRTCSNLDRLHEAKRTGAFNHPVVVSKVRQAMEVGPDDEGFWQFVTDRWPLFDVHLIKPDSWLGEIPLGSDDIPDRDCSRWYELSIMATGKVALCCMDSAGRFEIGDLNEQSLFEVYNSRHYRERRVKGLSRKCIHPCSTCSY